jgi:glutathione S-transferase
MTKLQIIGVPQSTFVRTARIAAEELGVDYAFAPEPPHSPPVDAIHPLGKVPVMRHGPITLCESRAIIAYLEHVARGPRLTPVDPVAAAHVEQWASLLMTGLIPTLVDQYLFAYIFPGTADGAPDRARIEACLGKLEAHLTLLDGAVATTGYLGAEQFSVADAYLVPVLHYLKSLPEAGAMIAKLPALARYVTRQDERPSVRATAPPAPAAAREPETVG